jgi:hypothetical protein
VAALKIDCDSMAGMQGAITELTLMAMWFLGVLLNEITCVARPHR